MQHPARCAQKGQELCGPQREEAQSTPPTQRPWPTFKTGEGRIHGSPSEGPMFIYSVPWYPRQGRSPGACWALNQCPVSVWIRRSRSTVPLRRLTLHAVSKPVPTTGPGEGNGTGLQASMTEPRGLS